MGLILPQTVAVRMTAPTHNYYKKLGYDILPKDEFLNVNVEDLPHSSTYRMNFNCDDCGIVFSLKCSSYYKNQYIKYNGKTYCRDCINKGERNPLWNPLLSDEDRKNNRNYPEYHDFIKRVLARDNYTCQRCNVRLNDMEVHHMDGYNWCIPKRTDDTNGVTLCPYCHKAFHSLYGTKNNTKEQFEEWMDKPINYDSYSENIYILPQIYCFEDDIIYQNKYVAASIIGCNPSSFYRVCKGKSSTLYGKHYAYYNDYINNTVPKYYPEKSCKSSNYIQILKDRNLFKQNITDKCVICITTGEIFEFNKDPLPYGISSYSHIYRVCNGLRKHTGYIIQGNKKIVLEWLWYNDFLSFTSQEQLYIARDNESTLIKDSYLFQVLINNSF